MLDPRWHKVIRDLWSNKTRTGLVVMAIALGVAAFGSVFISQEIFLADMDTQYRATNPSSITVSISSFDDDLVRWAQRQRQVASAGGQAVYLAKLLKADERYELALYAFNDYRDIELNSITPETGAWPPGRRQILLERASVSLAGAQNGDQVVIELPDGRQHKLTMAGTVHDLNVPPASLWPQLSGYVSFQTLEWLGFPSTYNRLQIVARDEFDSRAKLEKLADDLRERLQRIGVLVDSVEVREPAKHWSRDVSQAFTAILGAIGVFSLVLSGFLVVNTITAMLAQEKRQIGMMKAIGGTGGQITSIYLTIVACYGLLALAVALPAGLGLGYAITFAVAQFLNINILNFHLPVQVFVLELTAALFVPIVAAFLPIMGGVRVTVREAISSYGTSAKTGGLLDQAVARIRGLPRPVLLSLRNTFRRKGRLFMTLGTLVLAGMLFIGVMNVRDALVTELYRILRIYDYDVQLIFDGTYDSNGVELRAQRVPGVALAEGRAYVSVQRVKPDGTKGANFNIMGLPPDSALVQPLLLAGRWLQKEDRNAIVLSSQVVRDDPGIEVGDDIVLEIEGREYKWQMVGIVLTPGDSTCYAPFSYLASVYGEPGQASWVAVRMEQGSGLSPSQVAQALESRFKDQGIKVVMSLTIDTIVGANISSIDFMVAFLLFMAIMAAFIGGLGLAGTLSLNVLERTREIGVMRSIGASNRMVGNIVITEGLTIGIMSWLLAIPLNIPISIGLSAVVGEALFARSLDLTFSVIGVFVWLAIVVVISIVASLLPAYRASRMSVRETLAYE